MSQEDDYKSFYEYLHKGVLLLDHPEFDDFHFEVDKENSIFKELATLIVEGDINDKDYFRNIEPKASEILKTRFTKDKLSCVFQILEKIEAKDPNNKELCATTFASKLYLQDERVEHFRLPLIMTRLVEDIYFTFANN